MELLGIAVVPGPAGSTPAFSWGWRVGEASCAGTACLGVPASTVLSLSRVKGSQQRAGAELPLCLSTLRSQEEREAERQAPKHAQMHLTYTFHLFILSLFFLPPSTLSLALPFWHLCTQQHCPSQRERATCKFRAAKLSVHSAGHSGRAEDAHLTSSHCRNASLPTPPRNICT